MFKHILVPLDGSQMAESVLPAAAYLAKKLHAMITLIHVIEKHAPHDIHGQSHLQNFDEATAYLQEISRKRLPKEIKIHCHVHSAEVDDIAASIVAHTSEIAYDLVIMCTHGRGRALHLILGSIAQKVISMGSLPVLIIHPSDKEGLLAFNCNAILVPLDSDPDHSQSLPVTKKLAKTCGADMHLIMVIPRFGTLSGQMAVTSRLLPGTMSRMLDISMEKAEENFQALLKKLQHEGFTGSAHVLRGDPATIIADSAQQSQVDLIVLATHGKSGLKAFWSGSVANKVCSLCSIPLLLIPIES